MSVINEELVEKAKEMRAKGMRKRAIADELGVSVQTVSRWLPGEQDSRGVESVPEKTLLELRDAGCSHAEIARRTGMTRQGVTARIGPAPKREKPTRRLVTTVDADTYAWLEAAAESRGFLHARGAIIGGAYIGRVLDEAFKDGITI